MPPAPDLIAMIASLGRMAGMLAEACDVLSAELERSQEAAPEQPPSPPAYDAEPVLTAAGGVSRPAETDVSPDSPAVSPEPPALFCETVQGGGGGGYDGSGTIRQC